MSKIVDGRKFNCIRCGRCCKWSGYVFLDKDDIDRLSKRLTENDTEEFIKKYTTEKKSRGDIKNIILINKPDTEDCFFLENNKCSIYEDRPRQCKCFPTKYDHRCPGFSEMKEVKAMSGILAERVVKMNKKLSNEDNFDKAVLNNLYEGLSKKASASSITKKAIGEGIDSFFLDERVKVASLDELFAFNRVDNKHLIHKSTRDLWSIDADENGDVHITRLFESGKPVKG